MGSPAVYRGPDYLAAVTELPPDPLVHPDPTRPPRLYRLVVRLLRWLLPRLFRLHVEGLENIPEPPFIIASNHQAWYDTAFLLAALPSLPPAPMVHTMARRDTVFNRGWKRRLMPRLGIFPISPSRGELDGRAVATVYQLLAKGGVVLIFPEGRYSRGRALRPLKKGVAHFALQAGVPICPVALSGLDRLRLFGRVSVSVGPPIRPDPPAWWTMARRVERIVDRVRRAIVRGLGTGDEPRPAWRRRLGRLLAWRPSWPGPALPRRPRLALPAARPWRRRGANSTGDSRPGAP